MRDGWRETTLAEVADIRIGRTPPRDQPRYWTSDLARPFCTIADMVGTLVRPTREGVTERAEVEGKAKRVPAESLLLSFKLTIGRVGFADVDLFPNEAIAWVEPTSPDVDKSYLGLWLAQQDLAKEAGRAVKGNTLNSTSLRAIRVVLPPLSEQRRIVDLVDAVDRAASAASGVRARAATAYRLAADAAFGDSRLPQVPLASMAHITIGRQRAPQHVSGDHVLPYLRAANVKDGELELDDVLAMNFDPSEQDKFRLEPGDVLVTEGCGSLRELGASAQWMSDLPGTVCFQNTLLRLRARPGVSSPELVHHLARWAHHAGRWARIASGTNIFHIGSRRAASMSVPAVPLPDQEQVGALLTTLDALRRAAQRQVESLVGLRRTAVADLLSGEHEIPASYDRFLEATP